MNNQRRKAIAAIESEIASLSETLDNLRERIESIRAEEQEAYDNLPESLQCAEKGERMQSAIDALDNAASELEGLDLDAIACYLSEATE